MFAGQAAAQDKAGETADNTSDSGEEAVETADETSETGEHAGEVADTSNSESYEMAVQMQKPDHDIRVAIFPRDRIIKVKLATSAGDVTCDLYAGEHPLTVMNFIALSRGIPAWTDAAGGEHTTAYYANLPFGKREKGTYVASGIRAEGTNFVIPDERCKTHEPVAGAIAMVQPHPGMASAQFVLLARDVPVFKGLYPVFGQCGPIETIQTLTREDATLERVTVE